MEQPFWKQPLWRWDAMFDAGVRAHYYASQLAARSMVASRRGLIVNISFWAARLAIEYGFRDIDGKVPRLLARTDV